MPAALRADAMVMGGAGTGGRSDRPPGAGPPGQTMDEPRTVHVEQLHAQISSSAYEVDAEAVAAALLRRLLDGRCLPRRDGSE